MYCRSWSQVRMSFWAAHNIDYQSSMWLISQWTTHPFPFFLTCVGRLDHPFGGVTKSGSNSIPKCSLEIKAIASLCLLGGNKIKEDIGIGIWPWCLRAVVRWWRSTLGRWVCRFARHNDRGQSGQRAMLAHNWESELRLDVLLMSHQAADSFRGFSVESNTLTT